MNASDALRKVLLLKALHQADHEGFRHSSLDWWQFDARFTSPKTCDLCQLLHLQMFRGDVVPLVFRYHRHVLINQIKALVHPHCRCRLRWAGRGRRAYNTPLGILLPEEEQTIRMPSNEELSLLTPSALQQILEILSSPWEK